MVIVPLLLMLLVVHGPELDIYTKAQAEGAIEGDWTDYMVANKFETKFKFSRFRMNATSHCSPRDVAALRATHASLGISYEVADQDIMFHAASFE